MLISNTYLTVQTFQTFDKGVQPWTSKEKDL